MQIRSLIDSLLRKQNKKLLFLFFRDKCKKICVKISMVTFEVIFSRWKYPLISSLRNLQLINTLKMGQNFFTRQNSNLFFFCFSDHKIFSTYINIWNYVLLYVQLTIECIMFGTIWSYKLHWAMCIWTKCTPIGMPQALHLFPYSPPPLPFSQYRINIWMWERQSKHQYIHSFVQCPFVVPISGFSFMRPSLNQIY